MMDEEADLSFPLLFPPSLADRRESSSRHRVHVLSSNDEDVRLGSQGRGEDRCCSRGGASSHQEEELGAFRSTRLARSSSLLRRLLTLFPSLFHLQIGILNNNTNFVIPLISMTAVFASYTLLQGRVLDSSTIFSVIAVMELIQFALHALVSSASPSFVLCCSADLIFFATVLRGDRECSRESQFGSSERLLAQRSSHHSSTSSSLANYRLFFLACTPDRGPRRVRREPSPSKPTGSVVPRFQGRYLRLAPRGSSRYQRPQLQNSSRRGVRTWDQHHLWAHRVREELGSPGFAREFTPSLCHNLDSSLVLKCSTLRSFPPQGEMHFEPTSINSSFNLPRSKGVAYVPQEPWLQNATIRDNIILDVPFEAARFEKVVYACGLSRDLEILAGGDQTEVRSTYLFPSSSFLPRNKLTGLRVSHRLERRESLSVEVKR